MDTTCTYPRCKCIVSTSTTSPEPTCPLGLPPAVAAKISSGLPDVCWTVVHGAKPGARIGCIKRGESGYYRSDYDQPEFTDAAVAALVNHMNMKLGLTKAQVTAMEIGSMMGWHVPGANPAMIEAAERART